MRVIDFTPQWYLETLAERRGSRFRLTGLLIALAMMIVCSVQATSFSNAAIADLNLLQESFHAQSGLVGRLDQLDKKHAAGAHRLNMLDDVGGGITTADVVRELSHLMPESLTIRKIEFNKALRIEVDLRELAGAFEKLEPPPEVTTFAIAGVSKKGSDIGNLVSQMSRSPVFFDVQLRYERASDVFGSKIVEFVIDCKMPSFE
ncbi:MAG: PilN domain-containing protein [Planctomycetes bacterium]|nr:PilN domain-containing protein [Planctomycetota bacterium]